uniref:CSON011872 protein n=1 Tax=Culicoides sonorensis TaxID=179676 RepID=A0A336M4W3_CULSO
MYYIQLKKDIHYKRKTFHSVFCFCKCLLLAISGILFLYLLIRPINYRTNTDYTELRYESDEERELRLQKLLEQDYVLKWNHETVYLYMKELGLVESENLTKTIGINDGNNYTNLNQNKSIYDIPKTIAIACAFPGKSVFDHMWEYVSLWALQEKYEDILSTISTKTSNSLQKLLRKTDMILINEIEESNYDLAYAKIIGHTTPIHQIDKIRNRKVPILIEKYGKRYADILDVGLINLRQFIKFNEIFIQTTYQEMSKIKIKHGINNTNDIQWIGIYIDDITIPFTYFRHAMKYFSKTSNFTIFNVICSTELMQNCINNLTTASINNDQSAQVTKINIMEKGKIGTFAEYREFVFMSLCNNTIISNTNSLLYGILNGKPVVMQLISDQLAVSQHENTTFHIKWENEFLHGTRLQNKLFIKTLIPFLFSIKSVQQLFCKVKYPQYIQYLFI